MALQTSVREIVRAYFDTWTRGDIAAAGQYLAHDLAFAGSVNTFTDAAAFLQALSGYRALITTGNDLISELYGDDEATLIYDSHTRAGTIRTAEYLQLSDGKISSINLIFDPTALLAFKAAAGH